MIKFINKVILKYKKLRHYHKTRRNLKKGKPLMSYIKVSQECTDNDEISKLVVKEAYILSIKYNLKLYSKFVVYYISDDFIKGLKTVKMEHTYEGSNK